MATGDGQPRTYDVSDPLDVAAGSVNIDQLGVEISVDIGLVGVTLDFMNQNGDILDIFFLTVLDAGQIAALDALLLAHTPEILSPDYQFLESNPAQSTVSDTYIEALAFTPLPLQAGNYIVSYSIEIRIVPTGAVNGVGQARFRIGAANRGTFAWYHEEWNQFAGWDKITAVAGREPDLELQIRRLGGNDTIEYRRMKIGIEFAKERQ